MTAAADHRAKCAAVAAALAGKDVAAKEAALATAKSLASHAATPFLLPLLEAVLECVADPKLRDAANAAADAIVAGADQLALKAILPPLAASLTIKKKWQTKLASLTLLASLARTSPTQVSAQGHRGSLGEGGVACAAPPAAPRRPDAVIPFFLHRVSRQRRAARSHPPPFPLPRSRPRPPPHPLRSACR